MLSLNRLNLIVFKVNNNLREFNRFQSNFNKSECTQGI